MTTIKLAVLKHTRAKDGSYKIRISIGHKNYNHNGYTTTTKYTYDEQSRVTKEITSTSGSSILGKTMYKYDENGRVIVKDYLTGHEGDNSWDHVRSYRYQYDENGNMEEKQIDPSNGNLLHKKNYDKDGNVLIEEYYYKGKLDKGYQYEYDENGRLISSLRFDRNSDIEYEEKYGYDDAGNIVSTKRYDAKGNLISSEIAKEMVFDGKTYTFDANELTSIVKSLDASRDILTTNLTGILSTLRSISGMIQGSEVSGAINNIASTCSDASTAVDKHFVKLSTDITDYVNKTIRNEEETAQNIQEINSAIDEISFTFDEIN